MNAQSNGPNVADWFLLGATAFAALSSFLSWLATKNIAKTSKDDHELGKRELLTNIYTTFFDNDIRCQIASKFEQTKKNHHVFWKTEDYIGQRGALGDMTLYVSEYHLDGYLGYFELLGSLVQNGSLYLEDVDNLFGYYAVTAWNHKGVHEYIKRLRGEDSEFYSHFEALVNKLISITKVGYIAKRS